MNLVHIMASGLGGGGGIPKTGLLQWLFKDNQPAFSGNEVIDYSGNNNNGLLVKSNCLQPVTDITITLSMPRIGATVTELNTSTTELTGVAINASGHIEVTQAALVNPKIWQLKLSTGEEFVFSIGAFNKVYSVSSTANTGTLSGVVTTNWAWSTQDDYHYNIKNGCNGWADCSGTTKPITNFRFSTKYDCALEFDVYLTSVGVFMTGTSNVPSLYLSTSLFQIGGLANTAVGNRSYNFTTLKTTSVNWLNNFKHVKIESIKSLGTYGSLKVTVSDLDGTNSVSEAVALVDGYEMARTFQFIGGYSTFLPATGSMIRNVKYYNVDKILSCNIFYPIKNNQEVDVLGVSCTRNNTSKYIYSETKVQINPNNISTLTNSGFDSTYERTYDSSNMFLGKEFSNNKNDYLVYSTEQNYSNILKIYKVLKGLDYLYPINAAQKIETIKYFIGTATKCFSFLLTESNYSEYQIIPGSYGRLIGLNKPVITGYLLPNATKEDISLNSTLHISGINCRVDNIKAVCQNMRYPIHSDEPTSVGIIQIFEDVETTHFGNQEAIDYYNALDGTGSEVFQNTGGVGIGFGSGNIMKYISCKFKSHYWFAFFAHGKTTLSSSPNSLLLKNSQMEKIEGSASSELSLVNSSNSNDRIDFENASLTNSTDISFGGTHEDHFTIVNKIINGYVLFK